MHFNIKEKPHVDIFIKQHMGITCSDTCNTVNVVGATGQGIALEFKRDYPEMYRRYRELCEAKEFKVGMLWLYISFPPMGTEHEETGSALDIGHARKRGRVFNLDTWMRL